VPPSLETEDLMRFSRFCLLLSAYGFPRLSAQTPAPQIEFSIHNIMRGHEITGREPEDVRWSADGKWIYFRWLAPGSAWDEPLADYRVQAAAGSKPERLTPAQMDTLGPLAALGERSPDRKSKVVAYDGDLYVIDVAKGAVRRLTATKARERDPRFDVTGQRVYFTRDDNAFSIDLSTGFERQLTDIRSGPAPIDSARMDSTRKGQRAALWREESRLLGAVRDKAKIDSLDKLARAHGDSFPVRPLYLNKGEKVATIQVSPTGQALLLLTSIAAESERATEVPDYVTKSGYTEDIKERTKVGDVQDSGRVAWLKVSDGTVRWLHLAPGDTSKAPSDGGFLGWNRDGTRAFVYAVSGDFKTRSYSTIDAATGDVKAVDRLRDSAWVDGPCFGCGGWYDGGKRLWWVSEADGWAHLYSSAADGSDKKQMTTGKWEVLDAALSPDERSFYLHTSETSLFDRQLWQMAIAGGKRELITTAPGSHTTVPSPVGGMLLDVWSVENHPPEVFVMADRAGAPESALTTSPTAEWLSRSWLKPRIVSVTASDGVQVPARIYRPADLGAQPNGAGVIFVHGAGYLHNVTHSWSYYFREYMFNQYLASKGYVVLDLDYRGSAGYGRDWRTAIYRHMGGRDLQDQVDGSRYLQKEFAIDPERVGIYGGSYGGFITLMALFTAPKSFGAGAAIRSVTDWAHYDHQYTGQILNLPQNDSVAYRQSSPIYFAEGLDDPLLMLHGMVDRNVHFQDIVRLTQRLIELHKTNWELAVYPVEDHAFVRPDSWQDEYRRIYELFDKNLQGSRSERANGSR
jgi:dipeptidyl aminopeptidase/acylaminoacyl peptidase